MHEERERRRIFDSFVFPARGIKNCDSILKVT